jgi:hypothetical protein
MRHNASTVPTRKHDQLEPELLHSRSEYAIRDVRRLGVERTEYYSKIDNREQLQQGRKPKWKKKSSCQKEGNWLDILERIVNTENAKAWNEIRLHFSSQDNFALFLSSAVSEIASIMLCFPFQL